MSMKAVEVHVGNEVLLDQPCPAGLVRYSCRLLARFHSAPDGTEINSRDRPATSEPDRPTRLARRPNSNAARLPSGMHGMLGCRTGIQRCLSRNSFWSNAEGGATGIGHPKQIGIDGPGDLKLSKTEFKSCSCAQSFSVATIAPTLHVFPQGQTSSADGSWQVPVMRTLLRTKTGRVWRSAFQIVIVRARSE